MDFNLSLIEELMYIIDIHVWHWPIFLRVLVPHFLIYIFPKLHFSFLFWNTLYDVKWMKRLDKIQHFVARVYRGDSYFVIVLEYRCVRRTVLLKLWNTETVISFCTLFNDGDYIIHTVQIYFSDSNRMKNAKHSIVLQVANYYGKVNLAIAVISKRMQNLKEVNFKKPLCQRI